MLEGLLSVLAPHHCVGCESEGFVLCAACFESLIDDANACCCICKGPTAAYALCNTCQKQEKIDAAWTSGSYEGPLKDIIYAYKFERMKAAHRPLAELLHESIPQLFTTTIVVNLPTDPRRIRQRGYDHTELIARRLAEIRGLPYRRLLERNGSSRQLGAGRKKRLEQAKGLYRATRAMDPDASVLLVDDVITTGASVVSAAKALKLAGAKHVFVASCAYEKPQ